MHPTLGRGGGVVVGNWDLGVWLFKSNTFCGKLLLPLAINASSCCVA
jgi:hypothetical protein